MNFQYTKSVLSTFNRLGTRGHALKARACLRYLVIKLVNFWPMQCSQLSPPRAKGISIYIKSYKLLATLKYSDRMVKNHNRTFNQQSVLS